jgi:hypothetical protein
VSDKVCHFHCGPGEHSCSGSFRFEVGARVFMKKHPRFPMVVIARTDKTTLAEHVYTLRFENNPDDKRGFLVWDDAIV